MNLNKIIYNIKAVLLFYFLFMQMSFFKKKLASLVLASLLLNLFWAFFTQNVSAWWTPTWWKYLDMDNNGTVDHAVIYFFDWWWVENNITSCTYDPMDWAMNVNPLNILITWIDTGSGMTVCDGSSNELYLNLTADAGETGLNSVSDMEPEVSFNPLWSIGFDTSYGAPLYITLEDYVNPIIAEHTAISTPWYDRTPSYTFTSSEWWDTNFIWSGSCFWQLENQNITLTWWLNTFTNINFISYGTYDDCSLQINVNWQFSNTLAITPFTVDFCYDRDATGIPVAECHALVDLYDNLDGANWNDNTNWKTPINVGIWPWVTVSGWHVTGINLNGNSLSWTLSSSIGDLSNLTSLNLYNNYISGTIPSELWNLVNLTDLNLGINPFSSYTLPTAINNLTGLVELNLGMTNLTGSLVDMSGLTNIDILVLANNSLVSGAEYLWNLSTLTELDIRDNHLIGTLPSDIGTRLSNITSLSLNLNSFTGSIPTSLAENDNLTMLAVRGCPKNPNICLDFF